MMLAPESTLVMLVDLQDKLVATLSPESAQALTRNASILLDAAHALGVPVIATEQHPKGLGSTVEPLAHKLRERGHPTFEKLSFDALANDAVADCVTGLRKEAVVLLGMETHICVYQTARSLVAAGVRVFVCEDACESRASHCKARGLRMAEAAGARVSVTEAVVFDLLKTAEHPRFREISKLVR